MELEFSIEASPPQISEEHELAKYDRISSNIIKKANDDERNTFEQSTRQGNYDINPDQSAAVEEPESFGSTAFRELIRDAQVKLNDTEFEAFLSGSINSYDRYILAAETFDEQAENTRGGSFENLVAVGVGAALTGAASLYVLGRIGWGKMKSKTPQDPKKKPEDFDPAKQLGMRPGQSDAKQQVAKSFGTRPAGRDGVGADLGTSVAKSISTNKQPDAPDPKALDPKLKKEANGTPQKVEAKGGAGNTISPDPTAQDNVESLTPYFQSLNMLGGLGNSVGSNVGQFLKSEEDADNSELQGEQSALRALAESLKGLQDHSSESLASSLQALGKFLEQMTQTQGSIASAITV